MDWTKQYIGKVKLDPNWRQEYERKKISAEEAVRKVKSGDNVVCPIGRDPLALCLALASRKEELRGVHIFMGSPTVDFGWWDVGWEDSFMVKIGFAASGGVASDHLAQRRGDAVIGGLCITGKLPDKWDADVLFVEVSPPDGDGFCSFGASVYDKRHWVAKAKLVLAEVNDRLIRTCGDNFVHVSQIDYFVEHPHTGRKPGEVRLDGKPLTAVTEEQKQICAYVTTLIHDGDTIQVGQGSTSETLIRAGLLDDRCDIGWHSEVTPAGIIRLVRAGVITGKYKTLDRGKAVATAIGGGTTEDMSFVHMNPMFELRDIEYTHDPRTIGALDNMVTINNALEVDLTGQVNAESMGPQMLSGAGGLLAFSIGSYLSKNGRFIIVFPSTAKDGAISRIVPMLRCGSKITVPHTLADIVVTEYGIARLRGKSQRERAEELTVVARPDFRDDLKKTARELYWP